MPPSLDRCREPSREEVREWPGRPCHYVSGDDGRRPARRRRARPALGLASDDLNATLLAWPTGESTPEHVNAERDVLVVVLEGSGAVEVDGETLPVRAGSCVLVAKGSRRRIAA